MYEGVDQANGSLVYYSNGKKGIIRYVINEGSYAEKKCKFVQTLIIFGGLFGKMY
jgi:hypothetical protein